jgi:hypothetical protein
MGLVFMVNMEMTNLIPIGIFSALSVIVIIRKPYNKLLHNIRFCTNMVLAIMIQVIFMCYKIATKNNQQSQQIWLIMPIIVCILLIFCIIYNFVILIYEIVQYCKS